MRISILAGVIRSIAISVQADEPNVETATKWWPELTYAITPVGWRDHFHRFNIVYQGTIIARPPEKPPQGDDNSQPLAGVELAFSPSIDGAIPAQTGERKMETRDGQHVGDQGWADHP